MLAAVEEVQIVAPLQRQEALVELAVAEMVAMV
jgi:hypothetical protein